MPSESQAMVSSERHHKGHQPAYNIGQQRGPAHKLYQRHYGTPVHRSCNASDGQKPLDASIGKARSGRLVSGGVNFLHSETEHSVCHAMCIVIDDFGLHTGINHAALQLADMGHIHAISCMVGGPAWLVGSKLLQSLKPHQLDLGLHLDLTETPLLLGATQPLGALIRNCYSRQIDPKALRAEIRLQLDTFEQTIGRRPDYIDGHQHVHQFPIVRDELLQELSARYGDFKPWLRSTRRARTRKTLQPLGWRDKLKPWTIEQLGAAGLAAMACSLGYLQNRCLLGVYDFCGGQDRYDQLLGGWISVAGHGDLLMCHPSLVASSGDLLIQARMAEFQVLSHPALLKRFSRAHIALRPMSQILASGL
jgi:chitin disaccharide deacetylase